MSTAAASSANDLHDAAFGSDPGRWPLPQAGTASQLWLRAVAAGGQGRYAGAVADLDRLSRLRPPDDLASLALTTRASFLRQLGWHDLARRWDGRAAARAQAAHAEADALIGLAADALGVGRFAASARALHRAAELIDAAATDRIVVRHAWVSAECAMFQGDGVTAVDHAHRAVELAPSTGSARHVVKSRIVLAAALCSASDPAAARREGEAALDAALEFRLVPLRWAVASLLADIGATHHSATAVAALRDDAAEKVHRWGGVWRRR